MREIYLTGGADIWRLKGYSNPTHCKCTSLRRLPSKEGQNTVTLAKEGQNTVTLTTEGEKPNFSLNDLTSQPIYFSQYSDGFCEIYRKFYSHY